MLETRITICKDYDMATLRAAAAGMKIFDDFPEVGGKKVFIKPNLVTPPTSWDTVSCTNANVVRLVVEKCIEDKAALIRVGDCGFKNQWECTIEQADYCSLMDMPIEIIPLQDGPNFHKFTLVRFKNKIEYLSLYGVKVSDYVLECDVVINLPKLKVHILAFVTGAIKNMMGVMSQKGSMHPRGSAPTLHKRLCDLYFLMRDYVGVDWTLMDGVWGSEYTEHHGVPVHTGLLISGTDMWQVDTVAAQIMGIKPDEVPYLRYIKKDRRNRMSMDLLTEQDRRHFNIHSHDIPRGYERPLAWRERDGHSLR